MLQFMNEGDWREKNVGYSMLYLIDKLDIVLVGTILVDEVVEDLPN
jgi:hypothetical protein